MLPTFPQSISQFVKGMPSWFNTKLRLKKVLKKELDTLVQFAFSSTICLMPHPPILPVVGMRPPFSFDRRRRWRMDHHNMGYWERKQNRSRKNEIRFPHSVGLLYSALTYFLGFKVNSREYKVMGLAPLYGEPKYVDRIKQLITIKDDGTFRLNMKHFSFDYGSNRMDHL